MIDKVEFAKILDGRRYLHEITQEEETHAKENNLVVVFGYSDDNMELRGAINDEIGCYEGGSTFITTDGILENCDYSRYCKLYKAAKAKAHELKAYWCRGAASWEYGIDVPYETFNITKDRELYCIGIVFSMADIA